MKNTKWISVAVMAVFVIAAVSGSAFAQVPTATGTLAIQAVKNESMSISATAFGGAFDVSTGTSGQQSTTITTNWNLKPSRTAVAVCVYMTADLVSGTPASNTDTVSMGLVQAKVGAGSFAAINSGSPACGIATGVTTVHTYALANHAQRTNVSNTDTVQVQIAGVPTTIEPDTYNGTINLVAFTTP